MYKIPHETALRFAVGVCCWLGCTTAMAQQAYPNRPVTFVYGGIAGTSATYLDSLAITRKLSESIKQPAVVDLKPGANEAIALSYVAKAAPDGYTFLITGAPFATMPLVDTQWPADPVNDFTPVSLLLSRYFYLVVHPSVPANNLKEFVAYAKTRPGEIILGTSGAGRGAHLAGLLLESRTGIKMSYVHYAGGTQKDADLQVNRVQVTMMASVFERGVKEGKIKIVGVGTLSRNPELPDVPTLHEQGLKDFEIPNWLGVVAPVKTPAAIVNHMSAELAKVVKSAEIVKQLGPKGDLVGSTPEAYGRANVAYREDVRKVLKENNIKLQSE